MLRFTLILMFRNCFRNLSYSLVTMSGLVVGLTVAITTFLWVRYEYSYNTDNPDADRIYIMLVNESTEGEIATSDGIWLPNSQDFPLKEVPEVEALTRTAFTTRKIGHEEKWVQKRGIYADSGFFQVYQPKIIAGNGAHPFPDNHSIAISQNAANLLFENGDALGKTILLNRDLEFKVTAVYAPFLKNTKMNFVEFILPFGSRKSLEHDKAWGNEAGWSQVYLKLHRGSSPEAVEQKINAKRKEIFASEDATAMLFRMTDWRLYWNFENGIQSGGRIVYVTTFSIAAVFILIMACVNYMNIATARATQRAKEIGVRKMNGATQSLLIRQFMTESFMMTFISIIISLMIVYALLPLVNLFFVDTYSFSLTDPMLIAGLLFILLFTTLLAGSYPALVLSSFKPATVLKGSQYSGMSSAGVRKMLVVFQFTVSIIMIFCSLVMWQQTNYLLKKDLGYDRHELMAVSLHENTASFPKNFPYDNLKVEMQNHASIVSAAYAIADPMEINGWTEVNRVSSPFPTPVILSRANIDENYLPTAKLELVEGRNFSRSIASDSSNLIINEKAVAALGLNNPIGQRITINDGYIEGEIIGVVKDFHHQDIHLPVNPLVFNLIKQMYIRKLVLRYKRGQFDAAVNHIKSVYEKFQPGATFDFDVLDKNYEEGQLNTERLLQRLSVCFTIVAIVIACLGLFGLTLFNAQRRTKEIGIRKVLGASVQQIVMMLSKTFLKSILISFVIAFPIANYVMENFLEGYAFRISIPLTSFIIVGCAMIILVLLTVSYQSFQAAMVNPAESLKTE